VPFSHKYGIYLVEKTAQDGRQKIGGIPSEDLFRENWTWPRIGLVGNSPYFVDFSLDGASGPSDNRRILSNGWLFFPTVPSRGQPPNQADPPGKAFRLPVFDQRFLARDVCGGNIQARTTRLRHAAGKHPGRPVDRLPAKEFHDVGPHLLVTSFLAQVL
jgi:hypothetical protein